MKRWMMLMIGVLIVAIIGGAGYLGSLSTRVEANRTPEAPIMVAVTRGDVQQTVTAPGQLVGTQEVVLGMEVSGQLAEIDVRPGDVVQARDVLAWLDTEPLEEALETARLKLAQAQAEHESQLAEAQLDLQIAEAHLAQVQSRFLGLAAAEAALTAAQAELQEMLNGPSEDEITIAAAELRRAEIALQQAQWAYDHIAYADDVGASPEAVQLEEATLAHETSLANYRLAVQGPAAADVARARAQVQQAQAEYERILNQQRDSEQEITMLKAEVEKAHLTLERLQAGVDPLLVWEVAIAEKNLAAVTLVAPFSGVVLEVMAKPGEAVSAGTGVILLADQAAVEVRTTVIEEDLPLVEVGQPVELFFDAQPDDAVEGHVARIVPQRVQGKDRPLFHVYITPEVVPEGVVAGMTADASIIIAQRSDVLRLPRALVRARSDGTAQIKVWTDDQVVDRMVRVGLRGDVYVEILEGLREGEPVVGE